MELNRAETWRRVPAETKARTLAALTQNLGTDELLELLVDMAHPDLLDPNTTVATTELYRLIRDRAVRTALMAQAVMDQRGSPCPDQELVAACTHLLLSAHPETTPKTRAGSQRRWYGGLPGVTFPGE